MSLGSVSIWIRGHLIRTLLLGTLLAVVATSGGLLYGEHALVRLFVVPSPVRVADVTLSTPAGASDLQTTPLVASVTESQTVTSSLVAIPATVATGRVTFWCSPMTLCPDGYTVPAGTILQSTDGSAYRTLSAVGFPSCAPSAPVGISALSSGAAGNAAVGAVAYGRLPSYIHVTNPSPVVGGSDARSESVVEQADVDAAVKALTAKIGPELQAKLQGEAGGLTYLASDAPKFTTGGDFKVGQRTPTFTVDVTGTLDAVAFSRVRADGLLRRALSRQVPAGFDLASGGIDATYSSTGANITGSAAAYMIPKVDARAIAMGLRGQTVISADGVLQSAVAGAREEIRITPAGMPRLPMLADHISIQVIVQLKAAG